MTHVAQCQAVLGIINAIINYIWYPAQTIPVLWLSSNAILLTLIIKIFL